MLFRSYYLKMAEEDIIANEHIITEEEQTMKNTKPIKTKFEKACNHCNKIFKTEKSFT